MTYPNVVKLLFKNSTSSGWVHMSGMESGEVHDWGGVWS